MPTFDMTQFVIVLRPMRNPQNRDQKILVPCLESLVVRDPKDDSQIRAFQFRNNRGPDFPDPGRYTHVRRVKKKTGTPDSYTEEDGNYVDVERIDWVAVRDRKTLAQIWARRFRNTDRVGEYPLRPEQLRDVIEIAGAKVFRHVVRVTSSNEVGDSIWVDLELTDMVVVQDPKALPSKNNNDRLYVYRLNWQDLGDSVGDTDDPYRPTFMRLDLTALTVVDDGADDPNVLPLRLGPFIQVVNVNWGGAVEFETDNAPRIETLSNGTKKLTFDKTLTGHGLPGTAVLYQRPTAIPNPKKITISLYFNIFKPPAATGISGGSFIEFGGHALDNITSKINFEVPEGGTIGIRAQFHGPKFQFTWGDPGNFYDLPGWIPDTMVAFRSISGFIDLHDIDPIWTGDSAEGAVTFLDSWHALIVSVDVSGAEWDNPTTEIFYVWVIESGISYSDATYTIPGGFTLHTPLMDQLTDAGLGSSIDANNSSAAPVFNYGDRDGSTFNPLNYLPNPKDYANTRVYAEWHTVGTADPIWGLNTYVGQMMVSMPQRRIKGDTAPLLMFMDGKNWKKAEGLNTKTRSGISITLSPDDETGVMDGDGIVLAGTEIGIARQTDEDLDYIPETAENDVVQRLAQYQVWFGTFADLTDPDILKRFWKIEMQKNFTLALNKATFTADELRTIGPGPKPLSPAAWVFGKPDIYLDGGPPRYSPPESSIVAPPVTGFPKNQGKSGVFAQKNYIISYSPGPNNILVK